MRPIPNERLSMRRFAGIMPAMEAQWKRVECPDSFRLGMHEEPTMDSRQDRHPALLRRGSLMRIDARAGHRVTCLRGMVWLTREDDPLDRILAAGETFVSDRAATVLINALAHDAVIECSDAARCTITRAIAHGGRNALTLAAEIGRVRARIAPQTLRAMPAGIRREAVEREVRRMRGQVAWLVAQHAKRAALAFGIACVSRSAALLARAWRSLARTRPASSS
jgi:hypothetical protein